MTTNDGQIEYEVGDLVRVVGENGCKSKVSFGWVSAMDQYIGQVLEVARVKKYHSAARGFYTGYILFGVEFMWCEEWLAPIMEEEIISEDEFNSLFS